MARISLRASLLLLLTALLVAVASARNVFIQLTTLQSASVADGRSTVEVRARVLDDGGRPVRDGTQVVFASTLGEFRIPIVETQQGIARATLRAGSNPGLAKITASVVAFNSISSIDFLFVRDRSMLSSAKEYVEVTSPQFMVFNPDIGSRVIEAAAPNRGVRLRYRDLEVQANDLQYNVPNYEVRARKARVILGQMDQVFDEVLIRLQSRTGVGITEYEAPQLVDLTPMGKTFTMTFAKGRRFGPVKFDMRGITPVGADEVEESIFLFEDLTEAVSLIKADKAIAFPRREVQFQRAELMVSGKRVMRMPLYSFNMNSTSPLVTDNIFNVNDNQLAVNYPYFLSLRPGQTSLLRLRTGESYGRGTGAIRGIFLDYEMNWNRGDEMDGGLLVSGLGRDDWTVGLRQYRRFDDRTDGFASVEMPAGKSVYGSVNVNRKFNGFDGNISANWNRSLRGTPLQSSNYLMTLDKDPIRMGKTPLQLFLGVSASHETLRTSFLGAKGRRFMDERSQTSTGLRARLVMPSQRLDRDTNVNAEFGVSRQFGSDVRQPLAVRGATSLSRRLGSDASLLLTYNFIDDGFSSQLLGRHTFSVQSSYGRGRTEFTAFGSRALDVDRAFLQLDARYYLGGPWRLGYEYTFDRYLGESFLDFTAIFSYRLGLRDVGITWSRRTKRFGIQVINAGFN